MTRLRFNLATGTANVSNLLCRVRQQYIRPAGRQRRNSVIKALCLNTERNACLRRTNLAEVGQGKAKQTNWHTFISVLELLPTSTRASFRKPPFEKIVAFRYIDILDIAVKLINSSLPNPFTKGYLVQLMHDPMIVRKGAIKLRNTVPTRPESNQLYY